LFVFQKINEHTIHATAYHKVKTHPNVWTTANYNLVEISSEQASLKIL